MAELYDFWVEGTKKGSSGECAFGMWWQWLTGRLPAAERRETKPMSLVVICAQPLSANISR
jgi:hypothetical protein